MNAPARRFAMLAAALLALATAIGALGAHQLKTRLAVDRYEVLQTAVHYQFFHALGLLMLSGLIDRTPVATLRTAGWLLVAGVVLFCGSLYLLIAGAPALVGTLTPVGGASLIAAWCAVALGVRKLAHSSPDAR
jgi:uncharacterized membrane protein YgdD (TMEM256/DUF423 family)